MKRVASASRRLFPALLASALAGPVLSAQCDDPAPGLRCSSAPASSPLPRLNEPAPDFDATSTQGRRRLADYRGRWLILLSDPADFDTVCKTELLALARAWPQFQALDAELLGLSMDGEEVVLARLRDLDEEFGVEIPFPILEDPSRAIARAYGVIDGAAAAPSAVRATFLIDPQGVLKAMSYHPRTTGRSVDELLRLLAALHVGARESAPTPAALDAETRAALLDALDDERRARAFYAAVLEHFGERRPFANIVQAERTHEQHLLALLEQFRIPVPPDSWREIEFEIPDSFAAACAQAAGAERENIALYDRLLATVSEPVVTRTFQSLRDASKHRHLPAFERWTHAN